MDSVNLFSIVANLCIVPFVPFITISSILAPYVPRVYDIALVGIQYIIQRSAFTTQYSIIIQLEYWLQWLLLSSMICYWFYWIEKHVSN